MQNLGTLTTKDGIPHQHRGCRQYRQCHRHWHQRLTLTPAPSNPFLLLLDSLFHLLASPQSITSHHITSDHFFSGILFPVICKSTLPVTHIVINSLKVRGDLGPMTVWVGKETFQESELEEESWGTFGCGIKPPVFPRQDRKEDANGVPSVDPNLPPPLQTMKPPHSPLHPQQRELMTQTIGTSFRRKPQKSMATVHVTTRESTNERTLPVKTNLSL